MTELMADVDARSEAAGWPYTERPTEGFATSAAFANTGDCCDALRSGYSAVAELVWGQMPSFDEALETIKDRSEIL